MMVAILPRASSVPLRQLSQRTLRRRTLSAEMVQRVVQAPTEGWKPPSVARLSPLETLAFGQLTGQQTHRALRAMRSFLHARGMNFLCPDEKLRAAEKELVLPLHVHSTDPPAFRVQDLTVPLMKHLTFLHTSGLTRPSPRWVHPLSLQIQIDKGADVTKGLLKIVDVHDGVHRRNTLPIFYYVGNEDYTAIHALLKPLLTQLEEFTLPAELAEMFPSIRKVLTADTKATQTIMGLSESSSSTHPCPFCLIPVDALREAGNPGDSYPLRNSLQHGMDHFSFLADRAGKKEFARDYHNCKQPAPFIYGLPQMKRNIVIGIPVLHISIGLGSRLLKLARTVAPDKAAFATKLRELNLEFYAYHGETLIGPQVHKLVGGDSPLYLPVLETLKNAVTWEVYKRGERIVFARTTHYPRLLELFQLFAACYKLYTADRFLKDDEIESLERSCVAFREKFTQYYRWESRTLKLHFLSVEVPRFARTYKTVGLYSEQAVESIHGEVNELRRTYAGTGKGIKHHTLVFQALYRMHCPDIPFFQPPRRLCSVCDLPLAQNKDIHTACQLIKHHK